MNSVKYTSLVALAACALLSAGCDRPNDPNQQQVVDKIEQELEQGAQEVHQQEMVEKATEIPANKDSDLAEVTAELVAKSGSEVSGNVKLMENAKGVHVEVNVKNASPGEHGIHIHEKADCSSADGKSAGGHYDPEGHAHGLPDADKTHLGDMGNIVIAADGTGHLEFDVENADLSEGGKHSLRNRGLILHEKVDDGGQPTGNAGARIACAELAKS